MELLCSNRNFNNNRYRFRYRNNVGEHKVMANHVYFNISVEGLDEEQWSSLFKSETVKRKNYMDEEYEMEELLEVHEQPFMSAVERTYDDEGWIENSYSWYC